MKDKKIDKDNKKKKVIRLTLVLNISFLVLLGLAYLGEIVEEMHFSDSVTLDYLIKLGSIMACLIVTFLISIIIVLIYYKINNKLEGIK